MLSSLGDKYGPRVALAGCLLGSALSMVSIDHFFYMWLNISGVPVLVCVICGVAHLEFNSGLQIILL